MADRIQSLFTPQQLAAAPSLLYNAAARTRIDKLTVVNPSLTTGYGATIYWVPSGQAVPNFAMLPGILIQPQQQYDVWSFIGHTLSVGDAIYGFATSAAALNVFGSGVTFT